MQKTYEIKNKYSNEDDVVITIKEEVPQPIIVKEKTLTVLAIKNQIKQIENDIANLQIEREKWQSVLRENKEEIKKAIHE